MNESNLIIALGASFSNHTGITSKKPIIQIDFDPLALSKFHKIDVAVWGEISVSLAILVRSLEGDSETIDQRPELEARWKIWRGEKRKRIQEDRGKGINSVTVFQTLSQLCP